MESTSQEDDLTGTTLERFPVGKLGGMFASVPETIAPLEPSDMTKGVRHILSGEVPGATTDVEQDLGTE